MFLYDGAAGALSGYLGKDGLVEVIGIEDYFEKEAIHINILLLNMGQE